MELTERQSRVYDYIRATLEDGDQPSDPGISRATGIPLSTVTADIARLRSHGLIRTYRNAGLRCFDLIDTKPIEPVRVERHVCPNCQAINCANPRHGYRLTSAARVPAYMGA